MRRQLRYNFLFRWTVCRPSRQSGARYPIRPGRRGRLALRQQLHFRWKEVSKLNPKFKPCDRGKNKTGKNFHCDQPRHCPHCWVRRLVWPTWRLLRQARKLGVRVWGVHQEMDSFLAFQADYSSIAKTTRKGDTSQVPWGTAWIWWLDHRRIERNRTLQVHRTFFFVGPKRPPLAWRKLGLVELTAAEDFDSMAKEFAKLVPFPCGWLDAPAATTDKHMRAFKGLQLSNMRALIGALRKAMDEAKQVVVR